MIFLHPLNGTTIANLIKLYKSNGISFRYLYRSLYILAVCLITTPLRRLESKLYDKKIHAININSPIFIIGYWRSGTTFLHEILSRDPQFCYITSMESMTPYSYIQCNAIYQALKYVLSENKIQVKRPGDQMLMGPESPQEDELALANMTTSSYYHAIYFPMNFASFLKYLTLSEVPKSDIESWKKQLLYLYQKTAFINNNRTIISKNPPFTSKIKYLLEIFPNAKFIHIYRNPYSVYLSANKMIKAMLGEFSLQKILTNEEIADINFNLYNIIMKTFFEQQSLIPKENYTEIKFEDLEKNPLQEIQKAYLNLGLNGFAQAKDQFQNYLDGVKQYKREKYTLPADLADKIYSRLAFTIDKWGYKPEDL